jgi:hypothetical protein
MSSCDDEVNFPVGVFYCGSKGEARSIEDLYDKICHSTEQCLNCLESNKDCTFH